MQEKQPPIPKIDPAAAAIRLLGQPHMREELPAGWAIGKLPEDRLSIDDGISDLETRNSAPRLIWSMGMASRHWHSCPFFAARRWVVFAVYQAQLEAQHIEPHETRQAPEILADIETAKLIRAKIAELLGSPNDIGTALRFFRRSEWDHGATTALSAALEKASPLLDEFILAATKARTARIGHRPDRWRRGFVRELGHAWFAFTGQQPNNGEHFASFVISSWQAVVPNRKNEHDRDWSKIIRTVVKVGDDWQQRDQSLAAGGCTVLAPRPRLLPDLD